MHDDKHPQFKVITNGDSMERRWRISFERCCVKNNASKATSSITHDTWFEGWHGLKWGEMCVGVRNWVREGECRELWPKSKDRDAKSDWGFNSRTQKSKIQKTLNFYSISMWSSVWLVQTRTGLKTEMDKRQDWGPNRIDPVRSGSGLVQPSLRSDLGMDRIINSPNYIWMDSLDV